MVQYNVNDLLRVIGIKELTIIQLRLENLRLQRALQATKQPEEAPCQNCQGCQKDKKQVDNESCLIGEEYGNSNR